MGRQTVEEQNTKREMTDDLTVESNKNLTLHVQEQACNVTQRQRSTARLPKHEMCLMHSLLSIKMTLQ